MEEFERLEQELKGLYEQYIIRIRCIDALKVQLANRSTNFDGGRDSPIAKVVDGSMSILPEGLIDSDDEDDDEAESETQNLKEHDGMHHVENGATQKHASREELLHRARSSTRLRARTGVAVRGNDSRLIGSMTGGNDEMNNLDSSLGSDDTESEIDLRGDGLGNLHSDDDDDDDDVDANMAKLTRDTMSRNVKAEMSDEDF